MDYSKATWLRNHGFTIGAREPKLNTDYTGRYMVAEEYEPSELPTSDGRNGPWCIVGDSLSELVEQAYNAWA